MSGEWAGVRWAGDVFYGHCSSCGRPATSGVDPSDWWHCHATSVVDCRDLAAVFVKEGEFGSKDNNLKEHD